MKLIIGKLLIDESLKIQEYLNNNDINIVHSHGLISDIILSNLNSDIRKISTIHNNIWQDYIYKFGKIKGTIASHVHINTLKKIDYPISCSKSSYDILKNSIKNLTFIRNGIDINLYSYDDTYNNEIRKEINVLDSDNLFIYVGALTNRKNVLNLVKYFKEAKNDNDYLLILGDGVLMDEIKEIKDNNIKLLGFKNKDELLKYLNASNYYVSASLAEGFSLSVLEAISANNYLLLSDIDSHNEIFSIDNTYIGETFNRNNFSEQFRKLKSSKKNLESLSNFKNNYIDSNVMTNEYKKYYKGEI